MKLNYIYLLLLMQLANGFLFSCANPGAPTGGPKDVKPPIVKFSSPRDQAVKVQGKTIIMEFNEPVEVKNIKNNLLITPNTGNDYEYELRKNILTLTFGKEFAPNTTYVFDFGNAIEDITEHNKAINLKLAFSTGPIIDSLYISGRVADLFTMKPEIAAVVGLYRVNDTLNVKEDKPLYYTRTDSSGYYRLTNIKEGNYRIFAVKEAKKADLIYNSPDEKIALLGQPLSLRVVSMPGVELRTVRYDVKKLALSSARPRKQYFEVKANKKIADYSVAFEDSTMAQQILHSGEGELIRFYNLTGKTSTDSIPATITLVDSAANKVTVPIRIKFDESKEAKPLPLTARETPANASKLTPGQVLKLEISFNKPIRQVQMDSLYYMADKDTTRKLITEAQIGWNPGRTKVTLDMSKVRFKERIGFVSKKGAFISVENDSSIVRDFAYGFKVEEEYSKISGIVKTPSPSFILQLLGETGTVEHEIKNATVFKFEYVMPGKKSLRVLLDTDGDGKWETGDMESHTPPEPIYFYPEEIILKPNWEIEDIVVEIKTEDQ